MMFAKIGLDTIKTINSGMYRAHRKATWWVGDFKSFGLAKRALELANRFPDDWGGIYDGGVGAAEDVHAMHLDEAFWIFGNPIPPEELYTPEERAAAKGPMVFPPVDPAHMSCAPDEFSHILG